MERPVFVHFCHRLRSPHWPEDRFVFAGSCSELLGGRVDLGDLSGDCPFFWRAADSGVCTVSGDHCLRDVGYKRICLSVSVLANWCAHLRTPTAVCDDLCRASKQNNICERESWSRTGGLWRVP